MWMYTLTSLKQFRNFCRCTW